MTSITKTIGSLTLTIMERSELVSSYRFYASVTDDNRTVYLEESEVNVLVSMFAKARQI